MIGKIVWENTGDELKFNPCFPDFFEHYLDQLKQKQCNSFSLDNSRYSQEVADRLKNNLELIKPIAHRLPIKITNWDGDILDQDYLNQVHMEWVKTGVATPGIIPLLRAMNNLDKPYRGINDDLHKLERSFVFLFKNYDRDPFRIENVFGSKIINFDIANLNMSFDTLGRSSWDKFYRWDNNIEDLDTNDYQQLSGMINFTLDRPLQQSAPTNYVNWCESHKVAVVGNNVPLGNIIDLDKNTSAYRRILIRNTHEQSNKFFFELCS